MLVLTSIASIAAVLEVAPASFVGRLTLPGLGATADSYLCSSYRVIIINCLLCRLESISRPKGYGKISLMHVHFEICIT